jgi:hypothetical protein
MQSVPPLKRFLKLLSDFYSKITGNAKVDVLGNCTACESCSVYYKSIDEEECPKDRWRSIYIPNSAQKIKKQKNENKK